MKQFLLIAALIFVSWQQSFAQGKMIDPGEIMTNRKLYPTGLSNLQWRGDTDNFTWQEATLLLQGNVKNSKTDTILTLSAFNRSLTESGIAEMRRLPFAGWKNNSVISFTSGDKFLEYDFVSAQVKVVNSSDSLAENIEMAPGTSWVAYTIKNNLYISDGVQKFQVTHDENPGIVNGKSVHRNEFGIEKGIFWSPSGKLLAFYRMDESMVTEYPLVDATARVAGLNNIRYPMAGMKSHHVTVGIFNPETRETVFMKTGEPAEQYLTNIAWSPDQKSLYIAVLNRDQNHMKLNRYNAVSGDFELTLFEEINERYVEPLHPMIFLPGKPGQFIWQSQRDGFNHLYLYGTDGKLIRQLTSGNWMVNDVVGFEAGGEGIFYTSTEVSPLERHLYYLNLKNLKKLRLTAETGTHTPVLRADGKYFISRYSSRSVPAEIYLADHKSKKIRTLHTSVNPLEGFALGETSFITLKAGDGTDLYCRLIKPAGFDPARKYPVFIYVYGGPHAQLVTETWLGGANLFLNYMAQQGYVVFTLDNRGSANRGFAFESVIHRNLGKAEMEDQMTGVEYLKSLPWVDAERIGVDGWSYGGFMAISLKLSYPEVFKVASAGGPVIDWKFYEVMYGERYMDTPEQNPEGYKSASLLEKAGKLEGKLLIIHGAQDNTVVWQHSLEFLRACISAGKQVDYFVYPTHEHNVMGPDRSHLFIKIADYFNEYL
jgi:dipeptidyl-peptidase-4